MSNKAKKLAEEISFRLLATKKHADHKWLVKKLKSFYKLKKKIIYALTQQGLQRRLLYHNR